MAFDSFRDFVNALHNAGELKRISQPVATELGTFLPTNLVARKLTQRRMN
jgi:3-polyprenyl-4-hydroxybenzoate decarboxylase